MRDLAERLKYFTESVIRNTTRLATRYGAINLAQGMPDFEPAAEIKEAACQAIRDGYNQYAITWGAPALREAIAKKARAFNGIQCDPETNITVCCGATECMMATMLALINPGDEVVLFQPFYENYGPDVQLSGAKPVWVNLNPPDWRFDPDELRRAFSPRTKAIIVNTPNNPTGRVFATEELTSDRGPMSGVRCLCVDRRDLRAHPLYGHASHQYWLTAGNERSYRHDQRPFEDFQHHGLAARVLYRFGAADQWHPQSA